MYHNRIITVSTIDYTLYSPKDAMKEEVVEVMASSQKKRAHAASRRHTLH